MRLTEEKYFCQNCLEEDVRQVVLLEGVSVTIHGLTFSNTHVYHQCLHCREIYEPHDDPDFNLKRDYDIYQRMVGKGHIKWE